MKAKFVLTRMGCCVAALLFVITGCQKIFDYLPGHRDPIASVYQVVSVASGGAGYFFNYNSKGMLESIITDKVGTGNPNYFFLYDRRGRPVQVISVFTKTPTEPGPIWTLHRYGYDNADQIVRDTSFEFGAVDEGGGITAPFVYESHALMHYDCYSRVVAEDDSAWVRGSFIWTDHFSYKYDANGNLAYTARQMRTGMAGVPQLSNDTFRCGPYDNKIQLRRTTPIWMFMDRNYSAKNSFTTASYNSNGLPLQFDSREYLQGLNTLIPFIWGNVAVEYRRR